MSVKVAVTVQKCDWRNGVVIKSVHVEIESDLPSITEETLRLLVDKAVQQSGEY